MISLRVKRVYLVLGAFGAICTSCHRGDDKAPIPASVQLGNFTLAPQRLASARNIDVLDNSVKFDLCSPSAPCDPRLRLSTNPVIVFVYKARPDWAVEPLAERAANDEPPRADPMTPVTIPADWMSPSNGRSNWYPLSRLGVGVEMPEAQFYSTSRKWPLAFCFRNFMSRLLCLRAARDAQ